MRIIEPSVDIIDNIHVTPYTMIERIGRICYKSEDLITDDSAPKFVRAMLKNGHHAMLEHSHIILGFDSVDMRCFLYILDGYSREHSVNLSEFFNITHLTMGDGHFCFVSGSFRSWIELLTTLSKYDFMREIGGILYATYPDLFPTFGDVDVSQTTCTIWSWDEFILYVNNSPSLSDTEKKDMLSNHLPITAIFTCDLLCHRELVRHRKASFAGESTRYCSYDKAKFGNEITVVRPCDTNTMNNDTYMCWYNSCLKSEHSYFELLKLGEKPEIARSVLPVSTKSELAITCTESEWQHILDLRMHGTTGKPHPQILDLMQKAYPTLCQLSNNRLK